MMAKWRTFEDEILFKRMIKLTPEQELELRKNRDWKMFDGLRKNNYNYSYEQLRFLLNESANQQINKSAN